MSRLGKIKESAESFLNQYKTDSPATYSAAQQAVGGLLVLDGFVGIESPFGNKKRKGILGSFIGIFVGLALVVGMSFFANLMGLNKLTATTSATVTSVSQPVGGSSGSSTCTPQASYVVNGKEYSQTSSIGSSSACSLTVGKTIEISYDPNNPGAWGYDINSANTILKIFPIAGILIALSSLVTFIIRLLSIIFGWKLLRNGRALARTLPVGTDLSTIKNEIRQNFAKHLFGFGQGNV